MGKGLFVTGTGTDTGKTYIAALMVKKLYEGRRGTMRDIIRLPSPGQQA